MQTCLAKRLGRGEYCSRVREAHCNWLTHSRKHTAETRHGSTLIHRSSLEIDVRIALLCKIHVDGSGDDPVVPSVRPIGNVIRGSPADIMDDASEPPDLPPPVMPMGRGGAAGRGARRVATQAVVAAAAGWTHFPRSQGAALLPRLARSAVSGCARGSPLAWETVGVGLGHGRRR